MTAKAIQDNIAEGVLKHGFAACVATILLYTQWSYLESATDDNRVLVQTMQQTVERTTQAITESASLKGQLVRQQADLERVIERQAAAFERLCALLERESK